MHSILVLTPQVPYPPQQGTALRNWGILRALAERYEVSLLSFYASESLRVFNKRDCGATASQVNQNLSKL